jgi:hypothetical protein
MFAKISLLIATGAAALSVDKKVQQPAKLEEIVRLEMR